MGNAMRVVRYADATMPTVHGPLRAIVYRQLPRDGTSEGTPADSLLTAPPSLVPAQDEHLAIVCGDLSDAQEVLCRVHSECWTGETLGSLKCDCREQLDAALAAIVAAGVGVLVDPRQEGRGIGLGNKIRAYSLQNAGQDTVEANVSLGFQSDLRSYELAAAILQDLGVASVALMTNNPDKLRELEQAGVRVARRIPHWGTENHHNRSYLAVKQAKLGHQK